MYLTRNYPTANKLINSGMLFIAVLYSCNLQESVVVVMLVEHLLVYPNALHFSV